MRDVGGRRRAHGRNLERENPAEKERELLLEHSILFIAPRQMVAEES